ncbi:MAG: ATP-binding cassette domain-containing protein [Parafilimonas sp.]
MKIILQNAGKRFSREWIFRKLNYKFLPGTIYAITGPNGSGKSTLLQVLSGAIVLNEGACEWQLTDTAVEPDDVHLHISIAAPYIELIEEMTAKEFLVFHSSFKKYIDHFSIADILQEAGLANAAGKQIRLFSSGMKQRLKLAQAIFSDVPVILLDEPCTNLDVAGFDLYYTWIENYCKNRLVIISSNDKNEYSFCNEKICLTDFKQNKAAANF